MTHIQAAKWGGYSIAAFDSMTQYDQAECVAGYLVEGRIEAVMTHRAQRSKSDSSTYDPFSKDDEEN